MAIKFIPKEEKCETMRKTVERPNAAALAIPTKPRVPVSDNTPTVSAPQPPKYDRNAAHKAYMKEYMRSYRKRKKEGK